MVARRKTLRLYLDWGSVSKARAEAKKAADSKAKGDLPSRAVYRIREGVLSASRVVESEDIVLPYGNRLKRLIRNNICLCDLR